MIIKNCSNYSERLAASTCIFCGAPKTEFNHCNYCGSYYLTQKQFEEKINIPDVITLKDVLHINVEIFVPKMHHILNKGIYIAIPQLHEYSEIQIRLQKNEIIKQIYNQRENKNFIINMNKMDIFIQKGIIQSIKESDYVYDISIIYDYIYTKGEN